jgi:hypothetical protein
MASRQAAILAEPPHILIGTPQVLLELLNENLIFRTRLRTISSVYVDEVDYMIESVPSTSTKWTQERIRKRMEKHPGAADQVLDLLFTSRRKKWEQEAIGRHASQVTPADCPQLIMSSATLRHHLSRRLCGGSGWIDRKSLVKISGDKQRLSQADSGNGVAHCVLIVSKDGKVRNIDGAQKAIPTEVEDGREISAQEIFNSYEEIDEIEPQGEVYQSESTLTCVFALCSPISSEYAQTELKLNQNALEVIAAAFALDVPSVAMLSLYPSAPVQRIVYELRALGVNAHSLDLLVADKGRAHLLQGISKPSEDNPILLVSTLATIRGLDLPELTHIFMLGLPHGRRADAYLHVAGRVGRFGRKGTVITVVEEREEKRKDDGTLEWARDESKRIASLFRDIGIVPTQLDHFD